MGERLYNFTAVFTVKQLGNALKRLGRRQFTSTLFGYMSMLAKLTSVGKRPGSPHAHFGVQSILYYSNTAVQLYSCTAVGA